VRLLAGVPKECFNEVMPGSIARNFHQGSRSEQLADYLFSAWGTVTPVRMSDDYGVDLYCTLTKLFGQRAMATDYYEVQVKSTDDPWCFADKESVEWLIKYPQPLFLARVDKKKGVIHVYHTMPRFFLAALAYVPDRLELRPEERDDGHFVEWKDGTAFSLSAPILRVTIADLLDDTRMEELRTVFTEWVRLDRDNCDLVRHGILRFRMPGSYGVNELPNLSVGEAGIRLPELPQIQRGIVATAEATECIGGQLGQRGDRYAALAAALFVDHLQQTYPDAFRGHIHWYHRLPADLGNIVCEGLNSALNAPHYRYAGIDAVAEALRSDPRVSEFLKTSKDSKR
jgi:hypothetical protein